MVASIFSELEHPSVGGGVEGVRSRDKLQVATLQNGSLLGKERRAPHH